MPTVCQENANRLALYGITLKKELKASTVLQLKNKTTESRLSKQLYDLLLDAAKDQCVHYLNLPKITFG